MKRLFVRISIGALVIMANSWHITAQESPPTAAPPIVEEPSGALTEPKVKAARDALVVIGKDVVLAADETAEAVVAIGGNVTIKGKVRDAAVAIAGDVKVEGEVAGDVVAVLGGVHVQSGSKVSGDAVAVGGKVTLEEGASVGGSVEEVDFGMIGLATPEWLRAWFIECVLKMRPLAPSVGWVWGVAGIVALFYLLVALILRGATQACASVLKERPATTFLLGVLTLILAPVVVAVLVATGIGAIVVPFLGAAFVLGGVVGKVGLLQSLGATVTGPVSGRVRQMPVFSFLVGLALLWVLYIIPVLGLFAVAVTGIWALGASVTALFAGLRRELPSSASTTGNGLQSTPPAGTFQQAGRAEPMPVETQTQQAAPSSEWAALPKATFWERMAAGFLDTIIVSLLGGLVGGPPLGFLVALGYFAAFWAWKGTTVGGTIFGLKVVREDGRNVSFVVAMVRGLGAGFSIMAFFLGFLWIAWDKNKQGWHDKIAGTGVVKLPRGTPLVCL